MNDRQSQILDIKRDIAELDNISPEDLNKVNFSDEKFQKISQRLKLLVVKYNELAEKLGTEHREKFDNGIESWDKSGGNDERRKLVANIKKAFKIRNKLMRLYLIFSKPDEIKKGIRYFNLVERDCSDFLSIVRDSKKFLYRGVTDSKLSAFVSKSLDNRQPKDTTVKAHIIINDLLKIAGFEARRDNSIFCSTAHQIAAGYGNEVYLIFPQNGFNFTYSRYADLYADLLEPLKFQPIDAIIYNILGLSDSYGKVKLLNEIAKEVLYLHSIIRQLLERCFQTQIRIDDRIHYHSPTSDEFKQYETESTKLRNIEIILTDFKHALLKIRSTNINAETGIEFNIEQAAQVLQIIYRVKPELSSIIKNDLTHVNRLITLIKHFIKMEYKFDKNKIYEKISQKEISIILHEKHGFNDDDLSSAMKRPPVEIMINGYYYAFKYFNSFYDEYGNNDINDDYDSISSLILQNLILKNKIY